MTAWDVFVALCWIYVIVSVAQALIELAWRGWRDLTTREASLRDQSRLIRSALARSGYTATILYYSGTSEGWRVEVIGMHDLEPLALAAPTYRDLIELIKGLPPVFDPYRPKNEVAHG